MAQPISSSISTKKKKKNYNKKNVQKFDGGRLFTPISMRICLGPELPSALVLQNAPVLHLPLRLSELLRFWVRLGFRQDLDGDIYVVIISNKKYPKRRSKKL
jgi:hypothetical protein